LKQSKKAAILKTLPKISLRCATPLANDTEKQSIARLTDKNSKASNVIT